MTEETAAAALLGLVLGAGTAAALVPIFLRRAPEALVRVNVSGARVPAALGVPLIVGGLLALGAGSPLGWDSAGDARVAAAIAMVVAVMGAAGRYDDLRGDEQSRGFRGHLAARRLTGGVVKMLAGGLAGLAAGALTSGSSDILFVVETGVLVALTANLLNLMDRAPGRAAKVWLLLAVPLVVAGSPDWSVAAAGLLGASLVCLVPDLREAGMLGDMGANPLGAAAGLGLALSLDRPSRLVALSVLLVLNVASERVSFSRVIDGTRFLRALDRIGRRSRAK